MAFRKRAGRGDKKRFSKFARRTQKRNINTRPMRGGIRL